MTLTGEYARTDFPINLSYGISKLDRKLHVRVSNYWYNLNQRKPPEKKTCFTEQKTSIDQQMPS